jgi:hypothetical protein
MSVVPGSARCSDNAAGSTNPLRQEIEDSDWPAAEVGRSRARQDTNAIESLLLRESTRLRVADTDICLLGPLVPQEPVHESGCGIKLGRGNKKDGKRSADEKRWGMSRARESNQCSVGHYLSGIFARPRRSVRL